VTDTVLGFTDEDSEMAIGLAVGAASVCWEYPERAGVFDSERADRIVTELVAHLRRLRLVPDRSQHPQSSYTGAGVSKDALKFDGATADPAPSGVIEASPSGVIEASPSGVIEAWTVPGKSPDYHSWMQRKLRREWPVLGAALDVAAYGED
jgi:hypothetical protein